VSVPNTEPTICHATPTLDRPVTEIIPKYPKHALITKTQGDVILDLIVSDKGKVVLVSVVSGDSQLSLEAAKAVRKWEYLPSEEPDRRTRVTLVFKIDYDGSPVIGAEFASPRNPSLCKEDQRVTAPRPVYFPDPSYSNEARRAKRQGVCVLSLIVGPDGLPRDIVIKRALGYGLDDKATEAVKQWKFDPALKNGEPVAVKIDVEILFRFY